MHPHQNSEHPRLVRATPYSLVDRACIWFVRKFLTRILRGRLELVWPDGTVESFGIPDSCECAKLEVRSFSLFRRVVLKGGLGLGESYLKGEWSSPDLSATLKLLLNNWHAIDEKKLNLMKPLRWAQLLLHRLRSNTITGAQNNIRAHYDLSNDFFRTILDPSMTYSCAYFRSGNETLEEAQRNKIEKILDKAKVSRDDHVLEIGSGWGGLAIFAAKNRSCKVTSLTVSEEQLALARQRAAEAGLSSLVDFKFCDYRLVDGEFDKIVSVEMMEAVGHEHLKSFFKTCERVLKPSGIVVLQVITMPDQYYDEYQRRTDFIQKYIFPGSHLPSLSALMEAVQDSTSLTIESVENIGPHYGRTLAEWRRRFDEAWLQLKQHGYDEEFRRMWHYYLCSCEAEFATRWLNVIQLVLTRPNNPALVRADAEVLYGQSYREGESSQVSV